MTTNIARGTRTAKPPTMMFLVASQGEMPTRRFQPTCRLGMAAYSFTKKDGVSGLLLLYSCKMVSTKPKPRYPGRRRGGAVGKFRKITRPMAPESRKALRISRYCGRCQKYIQMART